MEELALDIFRTDDFMATTMTELVNELNYVPYEIEAMGLFEEEYLRTTTVTFYSEDGALKRVPTTERGAPEPVGTRRDRVLRQISGPRIAKKDTVRSHEVQDRLSPRLPTSDRLLNANELVTERQTELIDDVNITEEFHRLGALRGVTLDADGTTEIVDFYDEFGIVAPAVISFNFATLTESQLRLKIDEEINTPMMRALKRRRRPGTRIHALVGDSFWGKLTSHPGYERMFLGDAMRARLGESHLWGTIELAGVIWHHYFGDDDGMLTVQSNQAIFFPVGAKDVFKSYYMPGEDFSEANQRAKKLYSIVSPDNRINMNEYVDIYVRTYPLHACLCPQALLTAQHT